MAKLKGKELMVFVKNGEDKYKPVAMAKTCSLELTSSTTDETTKDDNELYDYKEVTGQSWKLTTENLVCAITQAEEGGQGQDGWESMETLQALMLSKTVVKVSFNYVDSLGQSVVYETDSWADTDHDEGSMFNGDAFISNIEISGAVKETSTFSAIFTGKGAPNIV